MTSLCRNFFRQRPDYYNATALHRHLTASSTGGLANTYSTTPTVKLTASTGTRPNPFRYTARECDPEPGVYEYTAPVTTIKGVGNISQ